MPFGMRTPEGFDERPRSGREGQRRLAALVTRAARDEGPQGPSNPCGNATKYSTKPQTVVACTKNNRPGCTTRARTAARPRTRHGTIEPQVSRLIYNRFAHF
jgi:hypothetical protein